MKKLLVISSMFLLILTGCSATTDYKDPDTYIIEIKNTFNNIKPEEQEILKKTFDSLGIGDLLVEENLASYLSELDDIEAEQFYNKFMKGIETSNQLIKELNELIDGTKEVSEEINDSVLELKEQLNTEDFNLFEGGN